MFVCVRERERESLYMCVCVRETVCVYECLRQRESKKDFMEGKRAR